MFETIFLALAFGTVWFYAMSIFVFFVIMALSENEHELFAIVVLAAFVFLMEKSGAFNVFSDPWVLIKWSILYFVVGVAWSFLKWFSFLHKKADSFKENRLTFLQHVKKTDHAEVHHTDESIVNPAQYLDSIDDNTKVPEKLRPAFFQYLANSGYVQYRHTLEEEGFAPLAKNYKSDITTWIIWWPTSALWTIMSDPMVRIANWIFSRLRGTYQLLANRVFAQFD